MKLKSLLAALFVVGLASVASAATVTFNFDDLGDQVAIPANYGGAAWSGFTTASSFGATSLPNIAYTSSPIGILDYVSGFTALTFSAGVFAPGTFEVWDGLGGTGAMLGSLTINDPPANPNAFFLTGVAFAGVGKSVRVSGGANQIGWDDVTLTTRDPGVVPEPASLALVMTGFGLAGFAMRRRRLAVTV